MVRCPRCAEGTLLQFAERDPQGVVETFYRCTACGRYIYSNDLPFRHTEHKDQTPSSPDS